MQRKTFIRSAARAGRRRAAAAGRAGPGRQAHARPRRRGRQPAPRGAPVKFAEVVKAKSNGRIEVQVAPSAQLGDDAAMVTALRTGALDISANSQGALANAVPEYAAFGMPFLFADLPQAWKLLDGPLGKELAEKSADKGMVVLGYWDNGIRHMTNSKRPITKPEDLKGLKMRTPPDAMTVDIMQALGAEAQQIKFAELYVALQQGVVDGQENPLVNIYASKLYEVQKYLSLTGHKYEMTPFLMSKRSWDRLSAGRPQGWCRKPRPRPPRCSASCRRKPTRSWSAELKAKGVQVDNGRQGRVRQGDRRGRRQVDRRPDRPLRQEGDRRGARPVSCKARARAPSRARRGQRRRQHERPSRIRSSGPSSACAARCCG